MRSFAQRSQATPQAETAKLTTPRRTDTGPSRQSIPVILLQRTIGNHAVQRLLHADPRGFAAPVRRTKAARVARAYSRTRVDDGFAARLQRKPTVSSPGDAFELEADRVADQVMRMPEPQLQRACSCGGRCASCREEASVEGRPTIQRLDGSDADDPHAQLRIMTKAPSGQSCDSAPSDKDGKDEDVVMRKATGGDSTAVTRSVANVLARSSGGGHRLPDTTRTFMETRFGRDFGDVRIHTDSDAESMTKALHAEAFTTGHHIYFQPGRFAPDASSGRWLLAHELTHVVHQRRHDPDGRSTASHGTGERLWIQRYSLRGFPPAEKAAMHAAVPAAAAKVRSCSKLGAFDQFFISQKIQNMRYDYEAELGLCGWTFPSAWYVEIGDIAFNKSKCCDLASTIAHEVSHTYWFTEGGAQKLECTCFGCSC